MDLRTTYLGLELKNPIVPSASPLSESIGSIRSLEDMGAPAVVMHSLFEEQLTGESHRLDHYLEYGTESFGEALSYFPDAEEYHVGPDRYLNHIRRAKSAVDIPIIGSLNGISSGGWTHHAALIQQAGADGLELNLYHIPTNPEVPAAVIEERYLEIVRAVRAETTLPLAVKVGPHFTAFANMAARFKEAGADALVLFNRFYQPDLDLETLQVTPGLVLSSSVEMRLPLRWVAILRGRVDVDLAITSGVHGVEDVVKGLMAGANVTMMASALLKLGPSHLRSVINGLDEWLEAHHCESVRTIQGSMSQENVAEPAAFERANYMKVLQSWRPDPSVPSTPVRPQ